MKYKLINITTKQETLCDKVTIDGFDYYVSDKEIKPNDYFYWYDSDGDSKYIWQCHSLTSDTHLHVKYNNNEFPFPDGDWNKCYAKRVIATNNPNIDVPKVVDEVEALADKLYPLENILHLQLNSAIKTGFQVGYNKSQETHPFSEEDMIEFAEWKGKEKFEWNIRYNNWTSQLVEYSGCVYTTQELLQIWKEQQPKIVYYE